DAIVLEVFVLVEDTQPKKERPERRDAWDIAPRQNDRAGDRRSSDDEREHIHQHEERAVGERKPFAGPCGEMRPRHRRSRSRSISARSVASARAMKSHW